MVGAAERLSARDSNKEHCFVYGGFPKVSKKDLKGKKYHETRKRGASLDAEFGEC